MGKKERMKEKDKQNKEESQRKETDSKQRRAGDVEGLVMRCGAVIVESSCSSSTMLQQIYVWLLDLALY